MVSSENSLIAASTYTPIQVLRWNESPHQQCRQHNPNVRHPTRPSRDPNLSYSSYTLHSTCLPNPDKLPHALSIFHPFRPSDYPLPLNTNRPSYPSHQLPLPVSNASCNISSHIPDNGSILCTLIPPLGPGRYFLPGRHRLPNCPI